MDEARVKKNDIQGVIDCDLSYKVTKGATSKPEKLSQKKM